MQRMLADISSLAESIGLENLPVRIVIDRASVEPVEPESYPKLNVTIERDPNNLRGTGGVLKDIAHSYDPNSYLLVVNGAQVLLEPLNELAYDLAAASEHVSIIAHRDGTPSGVMLVRCGIFKLVTSPGFVDMKEQVLPEVAKHHDVGLVHRDEPSGLPIRTLPDYLAALRAHHHLLADSAATIDPFAENLDSAFSVVMPGAQIDPTAHIYESVILPGAVVGPGATIVRSVVASGATVRANQRIVGRLIRSATGGSTNGEKRS